VLLWYDAAQVMHPKFCSHHPLCTLLSKPCPVRCWRWPIAVDGPDAEAASIRAARTKRKIGLILAVAGALSGPHAYPSRRATPSKGW